MILPYLIDICKILCGSSLSWSVILWILGLSLMAYGCLPIVKLQMFGYKHPMPIPFLGTTFWIMLGGFQKCFNAWNLKYGQLYAVAESQTICLVLSDPALLKIITVKSFSLFPNRRIFPLRSRFFRNSLFVMQDDEWRWARKLILPTFTSSKMRHNMFSLMSICGKTLVRHMKDELKVKSEEGKSAGDSVIYVEAKSWFGCFTMDVIASSAFGLDLDSHTEKNSDFVKNAKIAFDFEVVRPIFAIIGLFPFLLPLIKITGASVFNESSLQFFVDIVDQTVQKRRDLKIRRNDYLQLLMDSNEVYNLSHNDKTNGNDHSKKVTANSDKAKLENDSETMHEDKESVSKKEAFPGGLPRDEYAANALLFFLAGYESTANALSWTARTLAWYPEVQEKMREEVLHHIRQAMRRKGNINSELDPEYLEYDDILNMKYMDQIIKEVMRLNPPITFIDRVASEDYTLDGRLIKKGTVIMIPIYALHRDPRLWTSPDDFDPDRFSSDRSSEIDPLSYMPFGYGPRNCIGLRFALLEIMVGLAYILGSKIKFVRDPSDIHRNITPDNTKFRKNAINYPKQGLYVGIESCT